MPVQVSSDQLRAAARKLREDAAENLRKAAIQIKVPEQRYGVEAAFDHYTTAAAYREYATALEEEFRLLEEASRQLADALEQTANDYDRSDMMSAERLSGPK
ncbi:type VII secretion target [Paractinoplanes durhamensis]|uniref:Uncharacterized protein n=1 Tax=Paractinoplanes durhamensis TaxID=113563 RepID=A0ABQ3YVC1_9ACTN|nr:type VII secretion target [Actinoplanes durhamensis]GIE01519.1 hypothetical protein Adu01nite_28690 [Actinoplanes durhamensis]